MSSSIMFTGSGFFVAAASQIVPGTVRVTYSSAPKASNPAGGTDSLNPSNYVLSGPGPYVILSANVVSGDPLSIDIVLSGPLAIGTWTIAVSNVQTPASNPLTAPTSAIFSVNTTASITPLSGGAETDNAETIIRKHLSPALKGPNWDGLIKALSIGDDQNWSNARAAFDQLFISSASGSWLVGRASDEGITKPPNIGLTDDLFRQLVIKTSSSKLVHEAIREILEVFYGQDSLRAFVESEIDEKYNLSGTPDLTWTLDEKTTFQHTFQTSEFGSETTAKAIEVAAVLTKTMRDLGSRGFAVAFTSPTTGKSRVRIYSGSLGLGSFVRVTGGSAQNILQFPSILNTYSGNITVGTGYTWVYSRPNQNTTRVSLTIDTSMSSVLIDLHGVHEGDYVNIGNNAQIGITGTFTINAVDISWSGTLLTQSFDIKQISFNSSAVQAGNDGYLFYRPIKNSILAVGGRTVVVAQTRNGHIDISIPATTQAVIRGPKLAAYGRVNASLNITRLQRLPSGLTTVFTDVAHGLATNQQVFLDNIIPASSRPFITPGNGAVFPTIYQYPASHISLTAETQNPDKQTTENGTATRLSNGQILFAGGYRILTGSYDGDKNFCNRYEQEATALIIDGTEADGATRHSQSWITTSALNTARQYHAASTYGTGAIVTGGMSISPLVIFNSAEQYTLGGSWVNLPSMTTTRAGHQQVELNSGSVMVLGGAKTEGTATETTEIYNGTSWSAGAAMLVARTDFQTVKLSDGRILAIGGRLLGRGHDADNRSLALWRLDESAGPTATDTIGTYPLTYNGGPVVNIQGKINNCLDFNSAPGSFLTGAGNGAAVIALQGEWTLECWFRRASTAVGQIVVYAGSTEVANDNTLLKLGVDGSDHLYWKWEHGAGVDVTQAMTSTLSSLPAYRSAFFNHVALRKSLNGLAYSSKVSGWSIGSVIAGVTSGARATITSVDGGTPGGASGTIRVTSINHLNFTSGENLVIIPVQENQTPPAFLTIAAVAGASVYDVAIFINGINYQTWTNQVNSDGGSTAAWYVATDPKIGGSGFPGFLDDIRVSQVARTDYEILTDFHQGWGNHESPNGEIAIGAVTPECEIYNGSWTRVGQMMQARAFHQAVVLPGDYVLVTGGLGYDPSLLGTLTDGIVAQWPSNSLRTAEIWSPITGHWSPIQSAGVRRHSHIASYLSSTNKVRVLGGISSESDDISSVETLNLDSMTWKTEPANLIMSGFKTFGATTIDGTETVIMGGNTGVTTNPRAQTFISGGQIVSAGGLQGQHQITATPTANSFQFQSVAVARQQGYTSTMGSSYQGQAFGGRYWTIATGSRAGNVTTLVFTTNHDLEVGDTAYVNTNAASFPPGVHTITAVTANSISYSEVLSNVGSVAVVGTVDENQIGFWTISSGTRTSNVSTLNFNFPTGITAHSIDVGDFVYVNSRTGAFSAGLKTVTAITGTSISYAETAGNQSLIAVVGSVSENVSPNSIAISMTAAAGTINDPGPYLFDPQDGISVTSSDSTTLGFELFANQQYKEVEIDNSSPNFYGNNFPDAEGYIIFGFGTEIQSPPVKYLGTYKSSGTTTNLILDYSFRFPFNYPVGTRVTLLNGKFPFAPVDPLIGGAWITASSAGRVAAEASADAALAAGISPDITIVYPGDRGLGGEGLPSHGTQKLSDKVAVWAGDDVSEEVQADRED